MPSDEPAGKPLHKHYGQRESGFSLHLKLIPGIGASGMA